MSGLFAENSMRAPKFPKLLQPALLKIAGYLLCFCIVMADASPAQTLATLHSFTGADGNDPIALTKASDGNFYGTTAGGGNTGVCNSYGCGTVFKMTPNGTLTSLHKFCALTNCTDGYFPGGGLIQASDGNLYGTTEWGGTNNGGTVFKITPSGTLTTVYNFCSLENCADGALPYGTLLQASDGNFYGTTSAGGAGLVRPYGGTVFKLTPGGTLTTLYDFCSQTNCADGADPYSPLVLATDGNFYGTTLHGGLLTQCDGDGCGTVFKITPAGTLTVLHVFGDYPSDGASPYAGLIQATDGNFYGTTTAGGANLGCPGTLVGGCGTVFKITPLGTLTTLHSFNGADGSTPESTVLQATDGNFYGAATGAPAYGGGSAGTLYEITPAGAFNVLYSFCEQNPCYDGLGPWALMQSANGIFYGTTILGGISSNCLQGCGTIFRFVAPSTNPAQFVPITPCRLFDTRAGSPIQGGTYQTFAIPQLGVENGCGDLSSASAYSFNLTLIPKDQQRVAYVTIWPAGQSRPSISTMNSLDGRTKATAAIVPAGASGAIDIYTTGTADFALDINGYFTAPSQSTLKFYPLTPCRVADTRSNTFPQGLGAPHLAAGVARDFPVLNNTTCIPAGLDAAAYSFNLTAIPYPSGGSRLGYLEVWPTGQQPQNPVSTLNNPTGTNVANAAIVPAGSNGEITVYPSNDTDLAIDINGYFAASGANGLSIYSTLPCRVIDTRGIGSGLPFSGTLSPPVDVVDSTCGIPGSAKAYVFNATVVPSPTLNYLTLWPDSENQPVVSTLNAGDGWVTSNMAIVPNINGKIDAYAQGITQLILDISSYFAP
jgi:uncharacterized repeat protein (TIGR03803 family)